MQEIHIDMAQADYCVQIDKYLNKNPKYLNKTIYTAKSKLFLWL